MAGRSHFNHINCLHQLNSHSAAEKWEKQLTSCSSEQSVSALLWHIPSMLVGGGGGEKGGGRVTREWNITLLNLGHHTRALNKRADPWSRDLETDHIKSRRNSVARQNYLWTKSLRLLEKTIICISIFSQCWVGLWDCSVRETRTQPGPRI